jgi:hypothetical protein
MMLAAITLLLATTADGKPDLSGLYDIDSGRLFQDIAADIRPQDFPIQPWAAALARQREQDMILIPKGTPSFPPVLRRMLSRERPKAVRKQTIQPRGHLKR